MGAEISLTTHSLIIDQYSFPLKEWELGASKDQRLANEGQERFWIHSSVEESGGSEGGWVGTVELAETVTVPHLSVRIARCRVVRRDGSADIKVPQNQVVMVDPECLPGTYLYGAVSSYAGSKW